jgi:uncharacterized protein (UPF0305 family)
MSRFYVTVSDLSGTTRYVDKNGRFVDNINKAKGFKPAIVDAIIKQIKEMKSVKENPGAFRISKTPFIR